MVIMKGELVWGKVETYYYSVWQSLPLMSPSHHSGAQDSVLKKNMDEIIA